MKGKSYFFHTLLFLFFGFHFLNAQNVADLADVRQGAIEQGLLFPAENKSVNQILGLMDQDGSFSDLAPSLYTIHHRIRKLAQAYYDDPAWQGNQTLKNAIYKSLLYWFNNINPGPSWGDWTRTEFFMPRWLGMTVCLMYEPLSVDMATNADASAIRAHVENIYDTYAWISVSGGPERHLGSNLGARLVGGMAMAAFLDDVSRANEAQYRASLTIEQGAGNGTQGYNYPHTGLTTDFSFHQHNSQGGQTLWGHYGVVFITNIGWYLQLVAGTPWDLSPSEYDDLITAITEGLQLFTYKTSVSFAVGGRTVLNKDQYGSTLKLGNIIKLVADNGKGVPNGFTQSEYNLLMDIRNFFINSSVPSPTKNKYFYTSDAFAKSRPDHHIAIRMLSDRTASQEMGMGYATLNYHLVDGATYFMIHGREYNDARVGMNYTSIPGTTIEQKSGQPVSSGGNKFNSNNSFAGGLSGERHAVMGFDLDKAQAYSTVRAQKGYFIFEDISLFLGTNIRQPASPNGEIWTTMNQVEWFDDINYKVNGNNNVVPFNGSTVQNFTSVNQTSWFHHDGIGYIVLPGQNANVKLWAETRQGKWTDIDQSNNDNSTKNTKMFHLVLNHGTNPTNESYAYAVVMNKTAAQVNSIADNLPVQVLTNNPEQQVVFHNIYELTQAILYTSNQNFITPDGFVIKSDKPAILMVDSNQDSVFISVSDPNQNQQQIELTINGHYLVGNGVYDSVLNQTTITVDMPQGIYQGKQVDLTLIAADGNNVLAAVPVNLMAKAGEGFATLKWNIAPDIDVKNLTFLRSTDFESYDNIGSTEELVDSFIDYSPFPGTSYYQMVAEDIDGQTYFSNIAQLKYENPDLNLIQIIPNPVARGEDVNISFVMAHSESASVQIFDYAGKPMLSETSILNKQDENGSLSIPTHLFSRGLYLISIRGIEHPEEKVWGKILIEEQ